MIQGMCGHLGPEGAARLKASLLERARAVAAASGGLLGINGLGAMTGPLIIGAAMTGFGPDAFFAYIGSLFALIALYALWRATRRATPEETSSYAHVTPQASPVALEVAQEVAIERAGGA